MSDFSKRFSFYQIFRNNFMIEKFILIEEKSRKSRKRECESRSNTQTFKSDFFLKNAVLSLFFKNFKDYLSMKFEYICANEYRILKWSLYHHLLLLLTKEPQCKQHTLYGEQWQRQNFQQNQQNMQVVPCS